MLPLTFIIVSVQSKVHTCGVVACDVVSAAWLIATRLLVAIGGTHLAVHKGRVGVWCWDHFRAEPKARRVPIEDDTPKTQHNKHETRRREAMGYDGSIYGVPIWALI